MLCFAANKFRPKPLPKGRNGGIGGIGSPGSDFVSDQLGAIRICETRRAGLRAIATRLRNYCGPLAWPPQDQDPSEGLRFGTDKIPNGISAGRKES